MNNMPPLLPVFLHCLSLVLALASLSTHAGNLDPLSPAEMARATQQASAATPSSTSTSRSLPANSTTPPERLLVERHVNNKTQTARLADVYTYDYATNETLINVIDLDTNTTLSTKHEKNLQLPLTANELKRASDLIFNDDEERSLLDTEFKRITGKTLTNPQQQLQVKAFVFLASSLPEQLNAASQQCGLHRCAQVLLYTADAVVFEVSPIVNLSAGVITQNIGF
jgi:Cu2+-containing amine oxidase